MSLARNQKIEVTFSKPTNVYFMTPDNFTRYKKNKTFKAVGGFYKKSPVEFTATRMGQWYVVIEKGTSGKPIELEGNAKILFTSRIAGTKPMPEIEETVEENEEISDEIEESDDNDETLDETEEDED